MAEVIEVKVIADTSKAVDGIKELDKSVQGLSNNTSKSESVQKTLGKQLAQSGQLSSALSKATGGMSDAFMGAVKGIDLTNISLKGMKGAILSTGVGVLVILLGELISILTEFVSGEKKSEEAVRKLTKALDDQTEAFDENTKNIKFNKEINDKYAKANGASKEQMQKTNDEFIKAEKIRIKTQIELLQALNKETINNSDLTDEARNEAIIKTNESIKKYKEMYKDTFRAKRTADADAYVEEKADENKRSAERIAKQKERQTQEEADYKAKKDALNSIEKKYSEDLENISDNTDQKKLDRQKQRALKELDAVKLSSEEKKKALMLLEEDFNAKQLALETQQQEKIKALTLSYEKQKQDLLAVTLEEKLALKQQRDRADLEADLSKMVADETTKNNLRKELEKIQNIEINNLKVQRAEEQKVIDDKAKEDKLKKDAEDLAILKAQEEAKNIVIKSSFDVASSLTTAFLGQGKKAQAIQKGLTLTQIGIDTANAFSKLMAGSEASAVATGPAYTVSKPIFYASGVLQILANVAKAKQALSSSGASGGGGGGAGGGAPTLPPAPSFNVIGAQGSNQIANTIGSNSSMPLRAYVVGNDVTSQQRLDTAIISNASLG